MAHKNQNNNNNPFTNAEKLTRADDLMSDVLDCFLWPSSPTNPSIPPKRTIKFTSGYRRPRTLNINDFRQIIHSVQTGKLRNLTEATTLIRQLPAVVSYMSNAEPPRLGKHIGLYLQLFLPKCGVRFYETDRYDQQRGNSQKPDHHHHQSPLNPSSGSKSKRRKSKIRPNELRDLYSSAHLPTSPASSSSSSSAKLNSSQSSHPYLSTDKPTHLAVFAAKDYSPNDIVVGCEGSFADLTEQEDLKLRCNAHLPIHSNLSPHLHRQSTDFSHIVNSRGKFQVFCGPARFVNHDCNNNVELLREGFTIKFKVIKAIKAGEEILTSYGMNYFGEKNGECMCATCERNGTGFYSSQTKNNPGQDLKAATIDKDNTIQIKKEFDEANSSLPSLGADTTDLSSLADGSDGTLSRASNTPALEPSPTSFSITPSQVRRQLALSCNQHLSASLDKKPNLQSHSRSPSTRRNKQALSDCNQTNSTSTHFVSTAKFLPTHDLTLPVLSSMPTLQTSSQAKIVVDFDPPVSQQPANSKAKPASTQALPIKRKTYWITTKQKQLGLVPWESEPISTPPPASISSQQPSISSQQPYSPQTPSLLNPTKRKARSEQGIRKKPKLDEEQKEDKKEKKMDRAPMRSYWISTKEKQLGIVPWETNKSTESSTGVTDSKTNPAALHQPAVNTRSTRASRKASQDTPDITRFPIAPKGSKLSYKVFQQGTQEAELLNTAIGRELLGFRPKVNRKNQQQQQQHNNTLNQKTQEVQVDHASHKKNPPHPAEENFHDTGAIDSTLEEISSFLMNHPELTTNSLMGTSLSSNEGGTSNGFVQDHRAQRLMEVKDNPNENSRHRDELVNEKSKEKGIVAGKIEVMRAPMESAQEGTRRALDHEQTTDNDQKKITRGHESNKMKDGCPQRSCTLSPPKHVSLISSHNNAPAPILDDHTSNSHLDQSSPSNTSSLSHHALSSTTTATSTNTLSNGSTSHNWISIT